MRASPLNEDRIDRQGNRKSLPATVATNSTGLLWYRADYELYWLRRSRREVVKLGRLAKKCRTFAGMAAISRELREWCERERILLRIPLPQAAKAPEPRRVSGQTLNYTELPVEQPATMHDATTPSEPLPADLSPSTPDKQ